MQLGMFGSGCVGANLLQRLARNGRQCVDDDIILVGRNSHYRDDLVAPYAGRLNILRHAYADRLLSVNKKQFGRHDKNKWESRDE